MMLFASVVFGVSVVGIIALFTFKRRELQVERTFFPEAKARADYQALRVKSFLRKLGREAERIPPTIVILSRILVREGALLGARVGALIEERSHKIADRVSHRHRFERRETNSDFLKRVAEGRGGVAEGESLESRE